MKRDFEEEYKNYIDAQVPNLWDRIESGLANQEIPPENEERQSQSKTEQTTSEPTIIKQATSEQTTSEPTIIEQATSEQATSKRPASIQSFMKYAVPIAACVGILVLSAAVLGLSQKSKNMDTAMMAESASEDAAAMEETAEAYPDEESESTEPAKSTEETIAEAYPAEATEETADAAMDNAEEYAAAGAEDGMTESAAMEKAETTQGSTTNSMMDAGQSQETGEEINVDRATLVKIQSASEELQEQGYLYAYTFELPDTSRIITYVSGEQLAQWEEQNVVIERRKDYELTILPKTDDEKDGKETVAKSFLKKLQKLP